MKVSPIKRYEGPSVPTRAILDEHPELLKIVPKRWQRNPAVLSALAGACVLWPAVGSRAQQNSRLMGSFELPSPQWLTESEAARIIRDEAKVAGIDFKSTNKSVEVVVPFRLYRWLKKAPPREPRKLKIPLDGADTKRRISYEFISDSDINAWEKQLPSRCIIDPEDSVQAVKKAVAKAAPKAHIGVFYDPYGSMQQKREELRAQVRDFIKWLKAQGVI